MRGAILPGTEVAAQGLRWEVVTVESLGGQLLYRLRGVGGAVQGYEIDLLHPFERIDPVIRELQPHRAASLRNWLVYHEAFLLEQALGPHALLAIQPGRLDIQPYQLVPVLRAIRMSRVRLFLADGVGLGKTVEAGLVITELMARRESRTPHGRRNVLARPAPSDTMPLNTDARRELAVGHNHSWNEGS